MSINSITLSDEEGVRGRTRAEPPICTAAWSMGWAFDAVPERTIGAVGLA
jgi:hypothetical protein